MCQLCGADDVKTGGPQSDATAGHRGIAADDVSRLWRGVAAWAQHRASLPVHEDDIPRPHPVLSKPITLRGIIATTGESRTDLTLHEQLQQRAAMGGPPERRALAAFRTILTEALASVLVAEIRKGSLDGSASAALANGLQTGQSAEPSTLQGSAQDNSAGVCILQRMDASGPWTEHLTKSALQMTPTIDQILEVLNRHRVRATYGAVGDVMRVPAQSVSRWLGKRRPEASWVVAKQTLLPTGYTDDELHPDLPGSRVVTTGTELRKLLETRAVR